MLLKDVRVSLFTTHERSKKPAAEALIIVVRPSSRTVRSVGMLRGFRSHVKAQPVHPMTLGASIGSRDRGTTLDAHATYSGVLMPMGTEETFIMAKRGFETTAYCTALLYVYSVAPRARTPSVNS